MAAATPKFIADAMLGRLTKWLRLLGLDTVYEPCLSDVELIRRAAAEGRILLTRDTHLLRRRGLPPLLFVAHDHFRDQLRQVVHTLGLDLQRLCFKRCSRCNELLEVRTKAEVRDAVPPYVLETQDEFLQCPQCRRIYWAATHLEHIRAELDRLERHPGMEGEAHACGPKPSADGPSEP